jgi:transcriptional regulator with XRE-family HTH domain
MDNLGSRMREVRLAEGLTLREFAARIGRSASFLSQIESGQAQPSVATLYAFAQILKVSIDDLFELNTDADEPAETESPSQAAQHQRAALPTWPQTAYTNRVSVLHPNHRSRLDMAAGVVWERLAATPETDITFTKIVYAPGATSSADEGMIVHPGYEYGYVLSGQVEVTIDVDVFLLREGESIGFDSSMPHLLRNTGDTNFEGVWLNHAAHE